MPGSQCQWIYSLLLSIISSLESQAELWPKSQYQAYSTSTVDTDSMNHIPCSSCWVVDSSKYLPYPPSSLAHVVYFTLPFHYKEHHCRCSNCKLSAYTTRNQGNGYSLCITTVSTHFSMLRHVLLTQDPLHKEEKLG